MSFRVFVYHCWLWGAFATFAGWLFAQAAGVPRSPDSSARDLLPGLCLGLAVGIIDALSNRPARHFLTLGLCSIAGAILGSIGGVFSGVVTDALLDSGKSAEWHLAGWGLLGLLVGTAPGAGDLVADLVWAEKPREAIRKIRNGAIGGLLGGLLGGGAVLGLRRLWPLMGLEPTADLWTPAAAEHAAYGGVVGLLIAWTQVLLRDGWVRVESGLGGGRQVLLSRTETSLGWPGFSDIDLHGDATVDRVHATIRRSGRDFLLTDAGTAAGTYINDRRIDGPVALCSGDLIRIGRNAVVFLRRGG